MASARIAYVVDDDVIVRRSLCVTLQAGGYLCRPFATGNDFLEAQAYLAPGCVLLDVHMPGLSGIEVQRQLADSRPDLPLLFMTAAGDIAMAVEAMKAGAANFLEKPFSDQVLFDNLNEIYARLPLRAQIASQHADAAARISLLTARERDVAAGLVAGLPNKLIAFELGLGVRTVETHRANMMRKLRVRSVSQVVQLALEAKLAPLEVRAGHCDSTSS